MKSARCLYVKFCSIKLELAFCMQSIAFDRDGRRDDDVFGHAVQRDIAADLHFKLAVFQTAFDLAALNVISGYLAVSSTISSNSLLMMPFCCGVKTSLVSANEAVRMLKLSDAGLSASRVNAAWPLKSRTAIRWSCPLKYAGPPRYALTKNLLFEESMSNRATVVGGSMTAFASVVLSMRKDDPVIAAMTKTPNTTINNFITTPPKKDLDDLLNKV